MAELVELASAAVEEVVASGVGALSDAGLAQRLRDVVGLFERVEVLAAVTAGAFEARGFHRVDGWASARAWLAAGTRLGTPGAGRLLGLGRFLQEHDVSAAAVVSGAVPAASGRLLAGAARGKRAELFVRDEAMLVDLAGRLSVDELAVVLRRWEVLADDALADEEAEAVRARRGVHLSNVGNEARLDGTLDVVDGAVLRAALEHAMGRPDPVDRVGGQRTTPQRRADALVEICRFYGDVNDLDCDDSDDSDDLDSDDSDDLDTNDLEPDAGGFDGDPAAGSDADTGADPGSGPDGEQQRRNRAAGRPAAPRVTVGVRVDLDVLMGSSQDPFDPAWLADVAGTGPVGRNTLRRLLCDSTIGRVVTAGRDLPLNLGAQTRLFTQAQRLAMIARDGPTCVVPGCTVPVDRCQAHHVDPYSSGGGTDVDNGAHICDCHHHCVHEGNKRLERINGAWQLTDNPPDSKRSEPAARRAPPEAA